MKTELEMGTIRGSGRKFTLPLDIVARTMACIGIRGSGKTVASTVMAEEMYEAGLLWTCIDPVGVWWGLRCSPDGSPGPYRIVVIGGEHADLPMDKNLGARYAEAILEHNVCCVIDTSNESKNTTRHFVTEFCDRLMELRPDVPRHIFLEEAPELVPQKPMGEQKRSLAAVDRLMRLGRNRGYGGTLISQRFATINKDVLTQGCENILAFLTIGKNDRKAVQDWIAEVVGANESEKRAAEFVKSLTTLNPGQAWFWSPQWLKTFDKVMIRPRKTLHPGETRTVGSKVQQVQLSDVGEFVERFKYTLEKEEKKVTVSIPSGRDVRTWRKETEKRLGPHTASDTQNARDLHSEFGTSGMKQIRNHLVEHDLTAEIERLRKMNGTLSAEVHALRGVIRALRSYLQPQYDVIKSIFEDTEGVKEASSISTDKYALWKEKLGDGPAKIIDALGAHGGTLRIQQLMLHTGYSSASVKRYLFDLRAAQIVSSSAGNHSLR